MEGAIRGYLPSGITPDAAHREFLGPLASSGTICRVCGEPIDQGWMGNSSYFCDEHESDAGANRWGFRTCMYCSQPLDEGMTNLVDFYAHEGNCFHEMMRHVFVNGYCLNEHERYPLWEGGYWDYLTEDGRQKDSGIFFTDWH